MSCNRVLVPSAHDHLLTHHRLPARYPVNMNIMDMSKDIELMEDMEKSFDRMEKDLNSMIRDMNVKDTTLVATRLATRVPPRRLHNSPTPPRRLQSICKPKKLGFFTGELTVEETGGRYIVKMKLGKDFTKENVKVSVKDRRLTIDAKIEHKSEAGNSSTYQEFCDSFTLPENVEVEGMNTCFTPEGDLVIEAMTTSRAEWLKKYPLR